MNPYAQAPVVRQLFVSEPYYNTIAVIDLIVVGNSPDQVFGFKSRHVGGVCGLTPKFLR